MIFWKMCKRCGKSFDIGINFDICPECRLNEVKNEKEKKGDDL